MPFEYVYLCVNIKNDFFSISISIEFPYIAQLEYFKQMDFEGDPNSKHKTLYKKPLFFSISISIEFPYIAQLEYCKKMDFEADPNSK